MGRLFLFLAVLWRFHFNAADESCTFSGGLPCQDPDEDVALHLLQRAAEKGHGGYRRGSLSAGRSEHTAQVMDAVHGHPSSTDMRPVTKAAEAVKALEVAQSVADREQWPNIEQMIRSVSSVVTESVDQLSTSLTSTFKTIEGHADELLKDCTAAKASLLQSVKAAAGRAEDRLATFEHKANRTLAVFLQHFGSIGRELHTSSSVVTTALTTAGQANLASHTGKAFSGMSAWAETCIVAVSNASDALLDVTQRSQDGAVHNLRRLNATLDALLDGVRAFVDSFVDATSNATQSLIVTFSSRLPGPAAALVNKTLIHVRDTAKVSGKSIALAAHEVTSGIEEASASAGVDEARGSSSRSTAGFGFLAAAILACLSWP